MLFTAHVAICIILVLLAIDVSQQRVRLIWSLLLSLDEFLFVLCLSLVVLQDFELAPYEVCLLDPISECVPMSARYKSTDHAGIIALSNKDFQSVLILKWHFHVQRVCIVDFPQQISVTKGFKRRIELSSVLLHRRLLLHCWFLYAIRNHLLLLVAFLHFSFLAELHNLKYVVHLLR